MKKGSGVSGLPAVDATKVYYLGQSLGAILGTLVMATDPLPVRANLNVPGAPIVDIILTAPAFKDTKAEILAAQKVTEGSLGYLQLGTTFQWILDPADPGNFAPFVLSKQLPDLVTTQPLDNKNRKVMMQLATKDEVIPIGLGQYLASVLGIDVAKTTYQDQGHGLLLKPDPDPKATKVVREQTIKFLTTGNICTPNITAETCQ